MPSASRKRLISSLLTTTPRDPKGTNPVAVAGRLLMVWGAAPPVSAWRNKREITLPRLVFSARAGGAAWPLWGGAEPAEGHALSHTWRVFDVLKLQRDAAVALAPYLHQQQPKALEIASKPRGVVLLGDQVADAEIAGDDDVALLARFSSNFPSGVDVTTGCGSGWRGVCTATFVASSICFLRPPIRLMARCTRPPSA